MMHLTVIYGLPLTQNATLITQFLLLSMQKPAGKTTRIREVFCALLPQLCWADFQENAQDKPDSVGLGCPLPTAGLAGLAHSLCSLMNIEFYFKILNNFFFICLRCHLVFVPANCHSSVSSNPQDFMTTKELKNGHKWQNSFSPGVNSKHTVWIFFYFILWISCNSKQMFGLLKRQQKYLKYS